MSLTTSGCDAAALVFKVEAVFFSKLVSPEYRRLSFIPTWCPCSIKDSSLSLIPHLLLNGHTCFSIMWDLRVTLSPTFLQYANKAQTALFALTFSLLFGYDVLR